MNGDFAQLAGVIAVAVVAAFVGIWKYLKTEAAKEKPATHQSDTVSVLAASFIDSRILKELFDTMRLNMEEYSRESRKMNRNRQELTQALEESTDAVLANTDATQNMHRFLRRQHAGLDGLDEIK